MSNSVTVKICGEEFKLITEDSVEYTQAVGSHVSGEMQKMLAKRVGRMDAAIMAAVNITDELFKMRETDEQLRAQIKNALDEAARAKAEANALKRESLSLQKRLEKAEKAQQKAEKAQKSQKSAAKPARKSGEAEEADDAPALLDEAGMAELVEKSKRPRKTRKTKAETVSVETVEEVSAEPAPEAPEVVAEDGEAAPEVTETVTDTPEAAEVPESTEEPVTAQAVEES